MKQLFNNDLLVTRAAETDHVPIGQVGQKGANNITLSNLRKQVLGYREQLTGKTSETIVTIPANSLLYHIYFKSTAGSPIVSIGTGSGLDDVWETRSLSGVDGVFLSTPILTETPIYLGISGGTVTINVLYVDNQF